MYQTEVVEKTHDILFNNLLFFSKILPHIR